MTLLSHRNPMFGFAAAALILTAVGTLVVLTALRFVADIRWVTHTSAILTQVDEIATLKETAVAAQRGYLLTDDPGLRTAFWETKTEIPHQLRLLDDIVRHQPVAEQLMTLEVKLDRRLMLAANTVDVYDRQGLPAAQALIKSNGGVALDREIEALFADIRNQEAQLLAARRLTSEKSANWLLVAAFGGIPLSLIMLATVYRVLV